MEHERIYAYHEAGRTVIGYLIGLKFEKVTISSGTNSHGDLAGFAGRGAIRRDKTRAGFGKAINIELAFTWAGPVAEVLYCDGFVPGTAKGAYGPNRIMPAEGGSHDFAHLASIFELTSKATGHLSALDVKDKAMPPIHDWVLARIIDNWDKVEAIATALLEKKTLSHDEISQIIETVS